MINLTIVARSLVFRTGLRALLETEEDIEVITERASLDDLETLSPTTDVLVMVIGNTQLEDLANLLRVFAHLPVLLLVENDDFGTISKDGFVQRAWGFLSMEATGEELASAIRALYQGLWVSDPSLITPILNGETSRPDQELDSLVDPLTNRELEVLQLLAQGLPNKQIANRLGISEHTIKFHISAIYTKLGATNRTEAVRIGVHLGLILL